MSPSSFVRVVTLLSGLNAACAATACGLCAEDKVKITVVAVLATDKNKEIDPRLADLAACVQKKHPRLTGFRIAQTSRKSLEIGKEYQFALVDKESVSVTIAHGADKNNRIELSVRAPQMGNIGYTGCCGKYLPIWTDYKNEKQESLIVAIMVEPCKK